MSSLVRCVLLRPQMLTFGLNKCPLLNILTNALIWESDIVVPTLIAFAELSPVVTLQLIEMSPLVAHE